MGVQKVPACCDDEAGRRGLMCNKSPTSSVQSNYMLPPYHRRQLTAYLLGPLVVPGKRKLQGLGLQRAHVNVNDIS
jgi:hypothetical protein